MAKKQTRNSQMSSSIFYRCCFTLLTVQFLPTLVVSAQSDVREVTQNAIRNFAAKNECRQAQFDSNGVLQTFVVQTSDSSQRILEFYKNEEVQKELELSETQQILYSKAVSEWESAIENFGENYNESLNAGDVEKLDELATQISEENLNQEEKLNSILLPHQRQWLTQIHMRCLIRASGLRGFLADENISTHLDLSRGEINNAFRDAYENQETFRTKVFQARFNAVDTFLEPLDETQKLAVLKAWPYLRNRERLYSEQLRIHLSIESEFKGLEKMDSVFERIVCFPIFRMSVSGLFEPIPKPKIPEEDLTSTKVRLFTELMKSERIRIENEF